MRRLLWLVAVVAVALSACTIRFEYGITVEEDESGTVAIFIGFDEEMMTLLTDVGDSEGSFLGEFNNVPDGWTVDEVSLDGFEGFMASADFVSFDEFEVKMADMAEGEGGSAGADFFSNTELTRDGDMFLFRSEVSDGFAQNLGESVDDGSLAGIDMSMLEDLFEVRFALGLPGEIIHNNADVVDGETLHWEINPATDTGRILRATSELSAATKLLNETDFIDVNLAIEADRTGSVAVTIRLGADIPLDVAAELAAVDGWTVAGIEDPRDQVQIQAEFGSVDEFTSLIRALESTTFDAIAMQFTSLNVVEEDGEMRVALDVDDYHPTLRAALSGESAPEMVLTMTLPGEVMSSNAQRTEGQAASWEVVPKDTRETFVAIADVGSSSPLLLILAAVVGVALVAGAAFLIRRRSQPGWSDKVDQGEAAEDR